MINYFFKKIKLFYRFFKIDTPLLVLIVLLSGLGLLILYSSSGGSLNLLYRQLIHLGLATSVMLIVAQIPPLLLKRSAPILMVLGIVFINFGIVFW